MYGFCGRLLSGHFLRTRAAVEAPWPAPASDRDRARAALVAIWRQATARLGPASSVGAVVTHLVDPLRHLLGFDRAEWTRLSDTAWISHAVVGADDGMVFLALPWGDALDRAWREGLRAAVPSAARWIVTVNGPDVRLADPSRPVARRALDVTIQALADHEASFDLAWRLLHRNAFTRPSTRGEAPIVALVSASDAHAQAVCVSLRAGVTAALECLATALVGASARRRGGPSLDDCYGAALVAVYRLLFLFFAEARALVPTWHPVYREGYGLEVLRQRAEVPGAATGVWAALQAMARLAHAGCAAGDLRVTAFNGRLFSPDRAPLLDHLPLNDRDVARAVAHLSSAAPERHQPRERFDYRDLGVEELGGVYESLLDYEPSVEPHPIARTGAAVVLRRSGTARRKATGTFYTPRALTDYLVGQTLAPLVAERDSSEILNLRVLDPAMGSGAFLVAACRYLADAYEAALVREGNARPDEIEPAERARWRRTIASRCVFGVDANPMAVQLARLSLWLATLAADRPLSFLDHHLREGDSLVGVSPAHALSHAPGWPSDAGPRPLDDLLDIGDALASAISVRTPLEQLPDDSAAIVRQKEKALDDLGALPGLSRLRSACDRWCAAWFVDRLPRGQWYALLDSALGRSSALPAGALHALEASLDEVAASRRFFHWPLEFPEAFSDAGGRERPDAGFDAVVSNPPWEMLRDDEPAKASRSRADRLALVRYFRQSGLYAAQREGHQNQFQLFVERSLGLLRRGGRFGLVVPAGLAVDHGCAALRRLLVQQAALDGIVGLDNRDAIFPVHRSVQFLLVTGQRGGPTREIRCRFGEHSIARLEQSQAAREGGQSSPGVRLTPEIIERLSGASLVIPRVGSTEDLQLAEQLAAAWPLLGAPGGWGAQFGRELNASEDRAAFVHDRRMLPVVEGKHLVPFSVRPDDVAWRLPPAAAARLLPGNGWQRPRLAYRDVAAATNRVTLVAAIVPARTVTTHTLYCLRTRLPLPAQHVLCALLNSLVANWLVRLRVTTHVSVATIERLPVPRPPATSRSFRRLGALAVALSRGAAPTGEAYVELQAEAARTYGIDRAQLDRVLDTFPLIERDVRDRIARRFGEG